MQPLLDAIQAEDLSALEQAYNQCDHNSVQIEGACVLSLTTDSDPHQFSGAYAQTETYEFRSDEGIIIGPSHESGEICKFLSKNVANSESFGRSYATAQIFGQAGDVEGMYVIEEWNVDENGNHTSLKSCRRVITKIENENVDPNKHYERVILAPGCGGGVCRI